VGSPTKLPFGDSLYHPFMVILGCFFVGLPLFDERMCIYIYNYIYRLLRLISTGKCLLSKDISYITGEFHMVITPKTLSGMHPQRVIKCQEIIEKFSGKHWDSNQTCRAYGKKLGLK
jgi:hypothetical protein